MTMNKYPFILALTFLSAAHGAIITPIGGSTTAPIGNGAIANVIDGTIDFDSFLQLGPTAAGPFAGPYTLRLDLGGQFNLTGMNLWNNAGANEFDGEGVNAFTLTFLDTSLFSAGSFSSTALDTLAPQAYTFSAPNVAFVDLTITSNHQVGQYVDFYEINFTGLAAVPEPSTWGVGILGVLALAVFQRKRLGKLGRGAARQPS